MADRESAERGGELEQPASQKASMSDTLWQSEALAKFVALVERRNGFLDQPPNAYLRRATIELPDTKTYYMLARVLGLRNIGAVSVRSVWVNENTTAYFIVYGAEVVEVLTHRGFTREIWKRWQYGADAPVGGGVERDRYESAFKHKRPKRVGGGLMRGPLTPRMKLWPVISTRSLRPARS